MKIYPHHVLVWVNDMERAFKFYTETLGLPALQHTPHFSRVGGKKFWISLHLTDKQIKNEKPPIINFCAKDVDKAVRELKKKGVKINHEPFDAAPGIRVAEFFDTEGNLHSISDAD